MKDYDKEIENIFLDEEEDILQRIRIVYQNSLKDVQAYAKSLQKELDELLKKVDPNDEIGLTKIRSKVYQLEYQKKLAQQISNYLDVIKDKDVNNITDYINKVYSNGFLTEQYRLMRSGIDITMPINQKLLKKAVTFNIDDIPLSTRLYTNVDKAKKEIINEISRGLSIGMSVSDMARNLQNTMGVSMRKAYQIAQNEGARVRQSAIIDSMREAKKKGADIVKQWSATLDGKTRPVHQELDGEWAEIEDDFKYSGGKVFAPKQFGIPSEDINCRCTLLSVPRWDIEDKHWQLDNERKELVKVKNYEDWYENYYKPKQTKPTTRTISEVVTTSTPTEKPLTTPMATTEAKKTYKAYSDFSNTFFSKTEEIKQIEKGSGKDNIKNTLLKLGFDEIYELCDFPSILGNNEKVELRISDLAYILHRHSNEIPIECYAEMEEVIKNYDVLCKGNRLPKDDYVFFKLFGEENNRYGLEVALNKVDDTPFYLVHFNYIGSKKRKAEKHLKKLLDSDLLIDNK